jgi:hypothetical protein
MNGVTIPCFGSSFSAPNGISGRWWHYEWHFVGRSEFSNTVGNF